MNGIREATDDDIPEIVQLLRQSLGESLMPKTERYWRWKHLDNPFGRSPVLTYWENGVLIGVRAFMRWRWSYRGKVFSALRAVDTATHPECQGRGIFKKLTLALVDSCKRNGDHFIFNTPNQQSKPGYLKMGWEEAGKLPLRFSVENPIRLISNFKLRTPQSEIISHSLEYLKHPQLSLLLDGHYSRIQSMVTEGSPSYLTWRYCQVPVASYLAIGEERGGDLVGLLIARIKETRWGRELRITDCFWNGIGNGKELKMKLKEMKKIYKIDFTTLSGTTSQSVKLLSALNFKLSLGPTVTLRALELTQLNEFSNFSNWSPSIGDLELF